MSRRQLIVCGALLIVGCIACWFFPLFHIRPLGQGATGTGERTATPRNSSPADPAAYVRDLWDGSMRTGDAGTEIVRLWEAFDTDTSKARSQYGRQAGLGGAWYFCVRGQGTVVAVENNRVVLTVANGSRRVCLELGVVVDNAVREAIGIKASEFTNSQDFNAVSSELNRRVEQDVIAPNRPLLKRGAIVDFVGCARIGRESELDPLCLIPIHLKVSGNVDRDAGSNPDADEGTSS